MKWLFTLGFVWGLVACHHVPLMPEWKDRAQQHVDRATRAWLQADDKVAQEHWRLAEEEVRRTADVEQLANLALKHCAVRVAARQLGRCEGFLTFAADASAQAHAYHRYLVAQTLSEDFESLPEMYKPLHMADEATLLRRLSNMDSPLERLTGVGVAYGRGVASPALLQLAVDTASQQGWSRALYYWLKAQRVLALHLNDQTQIERIDRRLALIEGQAPMVVLGVTAPQTSATPR